MIICTHVAIYRYQKFYIIITIWKIISQYDNIVYQLAGIDSWSYYAATWLDRFHCTTFAWLNAAVSIKWGWKNQQTLLKMLDNIINCGSIQVWLLFRCGSYSGVATIQVWLLSRCGYYSGVVTIQVWLLFRCGCYSGVTTIQVWPLFRCASIQVWLLLKVRCLTK